MVVRLLRPHGSETDLSIHGDLQVRILSGLPCSSYDLPNPGIKLVFWIAVDSLPSIYTD